MPEPDPKFGFEYDFEKYDVDRVGRLFGLPSWQSGDRIREWVRKWDANIKSMYDFAGRPGRGDDRDYRRGTSSEFHNYGTYLAWHAVACASGELLKELPIKEYSEWEDWVSRYSLTRRDGLWLSDGTVSYPAVAAHDLLKDNEQEKIPVDDSYVIASLANIKHGALEGALVISGSWSSPDGVNVRISSALVDDKDADLAARALATSTDFHMWLPVFRYPDEEDYQRFEESRPIVPWLSSNEVAVRLDDDDPLSAKSSMEHDRPCKHVVRKYGLKSADPWEAEWVDQAGEAAFTSIAWGHNPGRREDRDIGEQLTVQTPFLKRLLATENKSLVLLIKLERYNEHDRSQRLEGTDAFKHSWAIFVVDRDLQLKAYRRTEEDADIVDGLPEGPRYDLRKRFLALRKASNILH